MNRAQAYFERVNFSSQNEDWKTEARALQLRTDDVVACITGGGDRPLNLLAQCPVQAITAIDCNAAQNHLLELKVAAIETLDYVDYLRFLGQADAGGDWRRDAFAQLCDRLSPGAAAHWTGHPDAVRSGVLYCGRFERYFARIARIAKSVRPGVVEQLFEFDQLETQRRFVADVWDTGLWRQVFRLLLHPLVSRLFYGDPAYFARVDRPVGQYLYERILTYLNTHLARDSFMLSLVLRGRLDDANLPPYLTEVGHSQLRQRVARLEVVTADLVEHLRAAPARTYSRFSLSDLPSYLDRRGMLRLLYAIRRAARDATPDTTPDKARMVIRQFLCRYALPAHFGGVFPRQPDLEAELAADDQALAYEFVIAEIDPCASGSGDGVVVRPYRESDNAAALALECRSRQGKAYKLSFRRPTFHRRAQNFDRHFIAVAEIDGELVGVMAAAIKDAVVRGEPQRVAFFFDTRVDARFRRRSIVKRMAVDVFGWAFRQVDAGYLYTVVDNRVVRSLLELDDGQEVGGYRYLVLPTSTLRPPSRVPPARTAQAASLDAAHESMLACSGPFDFYSDPRSCPDLGPWVGSWLLRDGDDCAGCSAWDNSEILAEVVENLPWHLRFLGWLTDRWAWLRRRVPHVPRRGEPVQSWYLFDFHASRPDLARDLIQHVAAQAQAASVDYCYVTAQPGDAWVAAVRAEVPSVFSPVIPYTLIALGRLGGQGRLPPMHNVYVDTRDL